MISTIASLFVTLIIAIYLLIKELKTPRKYFGLKIWLTGTLTNFLGIIISLVNFLTLESVPLIYLSYLLMTLGFGLIDLALFKFVNKAISLKRVVFTFSPVVILLLLTAFNNLNLYLTFVVFVIIYYSLLQISIINYKNEIKMKSNWLTFTIIQMFLVVFLVVYLLLRLIANHANVSEMINYENVNVIVKSMALLFLINAVLIFLSLEVSLLFSEPKTKLFLKMLLELSDNVSIVISEKNNKIVAVHNDFVQLVKCDHKDELIKLDLSDLLVGYENYQDAKNNFKDGNTFLTKLNFYTKDNNSVGCDVLVRYLELKNDNYYLLSCLNDNLGANQYKKLAYEDELTKLPNRRKINEFFTSFKIEKNSFI
ncbi:MAG: hypothetical protein RBS76_01865 [Acholeplasmatales bacterium]|nr:hypothetical protein [Acholeplasmataceae bacterium]MCK9233975.1 hypothetical protein [Acholeplasmataceae bacterium]MCK9289435.1 hypothetical protein [Acholeplasmataceae bacterium]MCK9427842.1 hypothetical protein [Acholeplasmataceae bacterium]MDY0115227.1 hypothetical protein [Acholeplasmatales bacterium]